MKWPRGWSNALGQWRKVPEAKLCRRLLETEKGKETNSPPQPPAGARPCRHLWSSDLRNCKRTPLSYLSPKLVWWLQQRWENDVAAVATIIFIIVAR